jgi:hypothetical protein
MTMINLMLAKLYIYIYTYIHTHTLFRTYKYRNLALQVGGVSDETGKYGREFCGTST